ncbi:unnamed protein product [Parascedosporium putredinis]|uniref:Peptidase M14 domain-containing protein n=1 Tax=Parascedosporium putredinis TaxID=1442378 RepID=A0A9P1M7W8_9PEZI|nr:unnamed protein product [Parascedosporium putredinis]CAI7992489.1 unnamed protein product [Parascedosporium putredinis]
MRIQSQFPLSLLSAMANSVAGQGYADNQVSVSRDSALVAANFPDVNIKLWSPAFQDPKSVPSGFAQGTAPPTDQDTLGEARGKKIRVWLQGGVHGNEPAGDQGILALLGKLDANSSWAASVLDKVEILALPRYNPDGVAYFQRPLATGFDPNRDHALLQRKQTRDIKKLLNEFDPHILLDAHEYTASFTYGSSKQWIQAQDVQVTIFKTLESNGFRTSPYFTASSSGDTVTLTEPSSISQAGHNSAGLGQALTFLTETRGIRLADQHFHRRVAAGLLAAETIVQVAVDNADLVYNTIENARNKFTRGTDDIIVLDQARLTDTTIEFIDTRDGSLVDVPSSRGVHLFGAWSDVAERLSVLGVKVEVLKKEFNGTVEALKVESVSLASSRHEGVVHATITTSASTRNVRFPPGAYYVSTRQKNAAFAFVTLEPENISSFARYNIIPLDRGDEYPIFRV